MGKAVGQPVWRLLGGLGGRSRPMPLRVITGAVMMHDDSRRAMYRAARAIGFAATR